MGTLARTVRSNLPQTREHPSHEVLVDDWSHAYALAQNRRINHTLRQVVLTVARRMDDAGIGRLLLGRRGKKTRFSLPPAELSEWLEAFDKINPSNERMANNRKSTPAAAPARSSTPAAKSSPLNNGRQAHPASTPSRSSKSGAAKSGAPTNGRKSAPVAALARSSKPPPKAGGAGDSRESAAIAALTSLSKSSLRGGGSADVPFPIPSPPSVRPAAANEAEPSKPAEAPAMIEHRFVVRPDYVVTFELPVDLSDVEARRLARFVIALPFELDDD